MSLKSLASSPQDYSTESVRIVGTLDNEGTNFFTDLRVVLKNDEGDTIYVRPWLPMSTPPSPRGGGEEGPKVLSQYLGKKVELTAVVERGTLKKVGEVYLLKVESCKVLE